ncbi:MAG: hypothetical protein HY877_08015 [Deltaproteobacteria bacterium]|nr:hypothetical protein [Deltaproteobacteria bacterium]
MLKIIFKNTSFETLLAIGWAKHLKKASRKRFLPYRDQKQKIAESRANLCQVPALLEREVSASFLADAESNALTQKISRLFLDALPTRLHMKSGDSFILDITLKMIIFRAVHGRIDPYTFSPQCSSFGSYSLFSL